MIGYGVIFVLLLVGFILLFLRIHWLEWMEQLLQHTKEEMNDATRKRLLENRRNLLALQQQNTMWYRLERELYYSGWKRRMPLLTAEIWVAGNLVLWAIIFLTGLLLIKKWVGACMLVLAIICVEQIVLGICKIREMRLANDNLLKFLNFLGNYSITAGEVTGIFNQVSRYVEEPLKSALAECCYEAQTTGDAGQALLSMAEKVEHPKFKEIARNLEVSVRYCADFSLLVEGSRRSVREYLRLNEERKGMLREAVINMAMLFTMSLFALITVDGLIDASIWDIVCNTLPGKAAVLIWLVVLGLLARQFYKIHK